VGYVIDLPLEDDALRPEMPEIGGLLPEPVRVGKSNPLWARRLYRSPFVFGKGIGKVQMMMRSSRQRVDELDVAADVRCSLIGHSFGLSSFLQVGQELHDFLPPASCWPQKGSHFAKPHLISDVVCFFKA
jgi:hypothetical protein